MKLFLRRILLGGGVFIDLTRWVIILGIVVTIIHIFVVTVFIVDGASMEPNLHDKELVLLRKNTYPGDNSPKRGDVVVVEYPGDPEHKRYVKRVIGLPGELVTVSDGKVSIDDIILKENFLPLGIETEPDGSWSLSDKEYFLMGDNRPNSNDSRYFGGVEKRFFIGQAAYILFPRFRPIEEMF